ncbi:MAG: cytochrome c biogenesis CcdA family protein [Cypionkella sp.]
MFVIFGYLAGLLTLINPCVLPILPIVLTSSLRADRRAPIFLALGMSVSFVVLGLGVATLGPALGLREDTVARAAALMMMIFGVVMLVPAMGGQFATATAGFAARADAGIAAQADAGLPGQFLGGALLGAVWSPCIGPTLGAAIGLAAQGKNLTEAAATMLAFALGVSTLIIGLAYGARAVLQRRQAMLRRVATRAKPIIGAVFVLIGAALFFRLNHPVEAWFLSILPPWLVDLSVTL